MYVLLCMGGWGRWQEADAQCRTARPSEPGLSTVRHLAVVFQESNCLSITQPAQRPVPARLLSLRKHSALVFVSVTKGATPERKGAIMATRKVRRAYQKYLNVASKGSSSWVQEAVGYLVDLQSPQEQGLEDTTSITLADGREVEVPTSWKAVIMTDEGEVTWRWPGYLDTDGNNDLGVNIISKDKRLGDVFAEDSAWHFYRDDSRRAHVEPYDEN